jgi:hypothetical protein
MRLAVVESLLLRALLRHNVLDAKTSCLFTGRIDRRRAGLVQIRSLARLQQFVFFWLANSCSIGLADERGKTVLVPLDDP